MEDSLPLVNILCVTYNHEPFISQCLDGFIIQKTNFKFEVIIHDDASTDNTANIIREYELKYPDIIKPIYQKENQFSKIGYSFIEKQMFSKVNSKYVAICDGDDYWIDKLKLQKQVDFLETNNEYGLIFSDVDFLYVSNNKIVNKVFQTSHYKLYFTFEEHLINAGYLAPSTWLIRTNLLPQNIISSTDFSYVIMLEIMRKSKIYFLPEVTSIYRSREGSASKQKENKTRYNYLKGIFDVRVYYSKKYVLDNIFIFNVLKSGFKDLFFLALYNKDWKFLKESLLFFSQNRYIDNKKKCSKIQILFFYLIGLTKVSKYLFISLIKIITRRFMIFFHFNENSIEKGNNYFRRYLNFY